MRSPKIFLSPDSSLNDIPGANGPEYIAVNDKLSDMATKAFHKVESVVLYRLHQAPPYQQDNHFILHGYRGELKSFKRCIESLWYLHNESVNIWSHLLGSIGFGILAGFASFSYLQRYPTSSSADVAVFACFFGAAVMCLGMSATFHLTMAHSQPVSRWGSKLDYLGITILITGSFFPSVYYGFYCYPVLQRVYWTMISALGIILAVVALDDKFATSTWRPVRATLFVAMGLSAILPVGHLMILLPVDVLLSQMGLFYLVLQGLLYITGAAIYALRIPERFAPGTFDFFGSSHQIFHGFVLAAATTHFIGICIAYEHWHDRALQLGPNGDVCASGR